MLIRFQVHIHSLYQLILHIRCFKCVTTTNMLVFWSGCLSCLPVCQSNVNGWFRSQGKYMANLEFKSSGCAVGNKLISDSSLSFSVSVKVTQCAPHPWRALSLQPNLKKGWFDRTSTFRGWLLRMRGVSFFKGRGGVQLSHNKLKSEISNDKKSL